MQQNTLFNYDKYFNFFIKLYSDNKLPNAILLSGQKGIGKSTFAFHFINYIISQKTDKKYILPEYTIDTKSQNKSLIENNIHPNFYNLSLGSKKKNIEIDQVRNLISFLSKTSLDQNFKFVLINDSEYLNQNSSNALLKTLEEPNPNTYFFVIHDSSTYLLSTIKSRCTKFKIHFSKNEKKQILNKLLNYNSIKDLDIASLDLELNYETPGNLLNYITHYPNFFLTDDNIVNKFKALSDDFLKFKNHNIIEFIYFIIDNHFFKKYIKDPQNYINYYNRIKISEKIKQMKNLNLDPKNIFFEINELINNEKK